MGKKWVKAKRTVIRVNEDGIRETHQPGDWFQCRNMEMRALIVSDQIEEPGKLDEVFDLSDCGVLVGGDLGLAQALIKQRFGSIPVESGFSLEYPRTLLWNTAVKLRLDLLPVGYHRLTAGWQIAAPLLSYGVLARDIGNDEDRLRTQEVIRDLRVPVYETGLIYIRRCPDTERLMAAWQDERDGGGDDRLAFMRALYRVKPTINALPTTWTQ
jgi:hypothetical protein